MCMNVNKVQSLFFFASFHFFLYHTLLILSHGTILSWGGAEEARMDWSTLYLKGKVMLLRNSAKPKFPNDGNQIVFITQNKFDFFFLSSLI